jgi:hypothetical protein
MKRSEAKPALPAWIFIVTDLALIGAGAVIALRAEEPLTVGSVIAIVACVSLGAIAGLIPLVAGYERQKNEILDERQRVLEGMAQTLAASAEQISIATSSLHQINEAAQRNLQQAAQLPQKLQDKVTQLQDQIAAIRLGDTDKLETAAARLAKAAAELAKHEAAANQQAAGSQATLAKLSEGAEAIVRAQAAAVAALDAKLAELDAKLKSVGTRIRAAAAPAPAAPVGLAESPAPSEPLPTPAPETRPPASPEITEAPALAAANETVQPNAETTVVPVDIPAAMTTEAPLPAAPKRPRKPRVKEAAPAPTEQPVIPGAATVAEISNAPAVSPEPPIAADAPVAASPATETTTATPPPEPAAKIELAPPPIPAASPAEPASTAPAPEIAPPAESPAPVSPPASASPQPEATAPAAEPSPRKRAARKAQPDPEPSLDLPLDDTGSAAVPGTVERTISSDGATRLIATSYIGIGNRLFIRGEGAGLSWEKGVPLQFISIGKWRWETNEANAPVRFKLLKNDEQECTALGEKTLEPGHLHELSAQF